MKNHEKKQKSEELHLKVTKEGILRTNKHLRRCCFLANAKLNTVLESKQTPLRHLVESLKIIFGRIILLFPLFLKGYFYQITIMP